MAGRSPGHPRLAWLRQKDVDARIRGHDGIILNSHSTLNPSFLISGTRVAASLSLSAAYSAGVLGSGGGRGMGGRL